jgi:hypothetical protein
VIFVDTVIIPHLIIGGPLITPLINPMEQVSKLLALGRSVQEEEVVAEAATKVVRIKARVTREAKEPVKVISSLALNRLVRGESTVGLLFKALAGTTTLRKS